MPAADTDPVGYVLNAAASNDCWCSVPVKVVQWRHLKAKAEAARAIPAS